MATQQAKRSRTVRAATQALATTGRAFGRVLHQLWLEVTGVMFLVMALSLGAGSVREYGKYHAGQAGPGRMAISNLLHSRLRLVRSELVLEGQEEEKWWGVSHSASQVRNGHFGCGSKKISWGRQRLEGVAIMAERIKVADEKKRAADVRNFVTHRSESALYAGRSAGLRLRSRPRLSRRISLHARRAGDDVPRTLFGRCASTPAWATPRSRTSATSICLPMARQDCRWRLICRRRSASTRIIRWPWARSAKSAWPSIPSKTCSGCSTAST